MRSAGLKSCACIHPRTCGVVFGGGGACSKVFERSVPWPALAQGRVRGLARVGWGQHMGVPISFVTLSLGAVCRVLLCCCRVTSALSMSCEAAGCPVRDKCAQDVAPILVFCKSLSVSQICCRRLASQHACEVLTEARNQALSSITCNTMRSSS